MAFAVISVTSLLDPGRWSRPWLTAISWSPATVSWVSSAMPSGRVPMDSVWKWSSEPVTFVTAPDASITKPVPSRPTMTWGESIFSSSGAAPEEKSLKRARLVAHTLPCSASAIRTVSAPWLYFMLPVLTRVPIVRVAVSTVRAAPPDLS
jgi:hypothetical protein